MPLQDQDWIINDGNWEQFLGNIDPATQGMGQTPRDFGAFPAGSYSPEFPDALLVPKDRQESMLRDQIAAGADLLTLRNEKYDVLKSLSQGRFSLCWAFSTVKAAMYTRAAANLPDVRLSAWYVAGKVKGWQDQGGWNAQSLQQTIRGGIPSEAMCPSYSRSYDTSEVASDAATRKVTEWFEGSDDTEKATQQMISILLLGGCCMVDLNWMRHSMCAMKLVSLNPLTVICDNSWGEDNGNKGLYQLEGSRAIPTGGIATPRVLSATTR